MRPSGINWTWRGAAIGLLVLCIAVAGVGSWGQSAAVRQVAPRNPAFAQFLENGGAQKPAMASGGHGLGYIPAPVSLEHNRGRCPSDLSRRASSPPSTFDLRTMGKVTPVKDQGQCGSCWTFGTYGSLESALLTAETWDFSENNLKNLAGFDYGPCDGGDEFMSTAYLGRWDGPVSEADDPYGESDDYSPLGLPARKHVQNVYFLPPAAGPTDLDTLKAAIMTYGAVNVSFYYEDSAFDSATNAYYYHGGSQANHSVTAVGWDDNYDKANFKPQPPGNGALLIKNSWGTTWGNQGYFYISYYDSLILTDMVLFTAESLTNYDAIYQYDPLGWVDSIGYGTDVAWGANEFTAEGDQDLVAVSFYNTTPGGSYQLALYSGVSGSPTSGTLIASKSGDLPEAGFFTIPLDSPVAVQADSVFSVVVQMTSPGYDFPLAVQDAQPNYSSQATTVPGRSFTSADGNTWEDLATPSSGLPATLCLKSYAKFAPGLDVTGVDPARGSTLGGTSVRISGTDFLSGAAVTIGGVAAASVVLNTDGSITAVTPAGARGTADVAVKNPDGRSALLAGGFRYVEVPVIAAVKKQGSPFRLSIAGSLFHQDCEVRVNGYSVPMTMWKNTGALLARQGSALKAMVPKGVSVNVTVANLDDQTTSAPFPFSW